MTPPPPPMPIFARTFDFLSWLLPATNNFPRAHRHTVTQRLLNAAFDLRERLEEANQRQGAARLDRLALADDALTHVRVYLRLAVHWKWLTPGQYQHVAVMVTEIGRLLGGWQQGTINRMATSAKPPPARPPPDEPYWANDA